MIKSRWIIALLVALVCMATPAMAQSAPFLISGHVFDADSNPCNGTWVRITNTGESWDADNSSTSNYYQLVLNSDDVSVDNVLSIEASGCSQSKTVEHTVTQGEIDDGGFSQNITFEPVPEPDLIVESVYLNPYCGKHQYFANESNDVNVTIKNLGTALAGPSQTKVTGASGARASVAVGALNPGQNETVTITDTVLRPDGEVVTAIADCNAEVSESNEANNDLVIDEMVMNHGLKSKRFTGGYTGPDPMNMTTWNSYELNGNLTYSVGNSLYVSDSSTAWTNYTANWTADNLTIPDGATIVEARLYVYYTWERVDVMPDLVILEFNGVNQVVDAHYTDRKGDIAHGTTYDLPGGAVVYDVTADFDRNSNHADFYKTIPPAAKQVSMRGMMLVVIYADPTEPWRQIFVIEEFDNLYGANSYCTTPEEATAWALFTGPAIDLGTMERADLITIVNGAGSHDGVYNPAEGELIFNGNVWTDAWDFLPGTGASSATETELGARDLNVTDYLQATDNAVGFQSNGDWMEASNAFLVVEYTPEEVPISCELSGIGRRPGHLNSGDDLTLKARVKNTGEYLVYCQMDWQIKDGSGRVVETVPGDVFTEEAGNGPARTSKLWTVDLGAGRYTVTGILHYGATAGNLDCTDGPVEGGKFTVV